MEYITAQMGVDMTLNSKLFANISITALQNFQLYENHTINNRFAMNKLKRVLHSMSFILTGMIISSLWIIRTDAWKIYLPICLVCITFSMDIAPNKQE